MFILDRIDRELLRSLERLELKFGLSSAFFDKIPVRILLVISNYKLTLKFRAKIKE